MTDFISKTTRMNERIGMILMLGSIFIFASGSAKSGIDQIGFIAFWFLGGLLYFFSDNIKIFNGKRKK